MNNNLKKWLAALLCGAMMVSSLALVACNKENAETPTETSTETDTDTETEVPKILNGKTPAQVYAENAAAFLQGSTASMVVDGKYVVSVGGSTTETAMQMAMEMKVKGDDVYIKSTTPDGLGGTATAEQWYVGGYVYTQDYEWSDEAQDVVTFKAKVAATPEEAKEYYGIDGEYVDIPDAWWNGVEFVEDGENYTYKFTADQAMIEAAGNTLNLGALVEEGMKVTSMTGTGIVNAEGVMMSEVMVIEMAMEAEGVTIRLEMTLKTTYDDIGSTVVEAPADADEYIATELPYWDDGTEW